MSVTWWEAASHRECSAVTCDGAHAPPGFLWDQFGHALCLGSSHCLVLPDCFTVFALVSLIWLSNPSFHTLSSNWLSLFKGQNPLFTVVFMSCCSFLFVCLVRWLLLLALWLQHDTICVAFPNPVFPVNAGIFRMQFSSKFSWDSYTGLKQTHGGSPGSPSHTRSQRHSLSIHISGPSTPIWFRISRTALAVCSHVAQVILTAYMLEKSQGLSPPIT